MNKRMGSNRIWQFKIWLYQLQTKLEKYQNIKISKNISILFIYFSGVEKFIVLISEYTQP